MQNALAYLLSTSLIPVLCTDVTAGAARNVHGVLVGISAVRAFPDKLAVLFHDVYLAVPAAGLVVGVYRRGLKSSVGEEVAR